MRQMTEANHNEFLPNDDQEMQQVTVDLAASDQSGEADLEVVKSRPIRAILMALLLLVMFGLVGMNVAVIAAPEIGAKVGEAIPSLWASEPQMECQSQCCPMQDMESDPEESLAEEIELSLEPST